MRLKLSFGGRGRSSGNDSPSDLRLRADAFYTQALESDDTWAAGAYQAAIDLYRELRDSKQLGICVGNLALVNSRLGRWKEALSGYQEALKLNQECGYIIGVANALHNIGGMHFELGDLPSAIEYFRLAIPILRDIVRELAGISPSGVGPLTIDRADRTPEVLDLHRWALIATQKSVANCLEAVGRSQMSAKAFSDALSSFEQALIVWRELNNRQHIASALNYISLVRQEMRYH